MKNVLLFLFFIPFLSYSQEYPRGVLDGVDSTYFELPLKASATRSFYESAPKSFSLKKYAPSPASQGSYGTCTGWAVAYVARTIIESKKNRLVSKDSITKNAFSATYQYRQASSKIDCNGAHTSEVVKSLKSTGSVPAKDFFIDKGTTLCPAMPIHHSNDEIAKKYKVQEYATLWKYDYDDKKSKISQVRTSVAEGSPVVISMICPDSFDKVDTTGLWTPIENPTDDTSGRKHGRHALCVVGYDNDKYGGAFEVQNSWGEKWGNKGYCWIKYEDFSSFVYQAYEIMDFESSSPNKQYLAGSLRLFDLDDEKDIEVKLAGKTRNWNVVSPDKGGEYTYKVVPEMKSGSEMRMYLKSEKSAYVYMLGTGEVDESILTLFPVDGISPIMNYSGHEIALPSEEHYFKMDSTIGKNQIIIIFSQERLDIKEIKDNMVSANGNKAQKLKNAVGDILIDSKHITFQQDEIKFEVEPNSSGKKAFAMIIEFNQVE